MQRWELNRRTTWLVDLLVWTEGRANAGRQVVRAVPNDDDDDAKHDWTLDWASCWQGPVRGTVFCALYTLCSCTYQRGWRLSINVTVGKEGPSAMWSVV
jgi:hypothetical protein